MAVKRNFSINDKKACSCLKCQRQIEKEELKDDTIYTCPSCGQQMFVDGAGSRATLTVVQLPDFRRRCAVSKEDHCDAHQHDDTLSQLIAENKGLKRQLEKEKKNAADWEAAAEGLARMIEDMKEQTKI